jgi:hypothetical protein
MNKKHALEGFDPRSPLHPAFAPLAPCALRRMPAVALAKAGIPHIASELRVAGHAKGAHRRPLALR